MQLAEIIIREIERDRSFKVFQLFAESVGQPRQPAAMHTQRMVLLFDMGGGNAVHVGHTRDNGLFDFNDLCWTVSAGRIFVERAALKFIHRQPRSLNACG